MAFKHYDVVRAASPSDLAEKLTQLSLIPI
nr:DUF1737 domain-containing protein [Escherichia coli]